MIFGRLVAHPSTAFKLYPSEEAWSSVQCQQLESSIIALGPEEGGGGGNRAVLTEAAEEAQAEQA